MRQKQLISQMFDLTPFEDKIDKKSFKTKTEEFINEFLNKIDWRVYENANRAQTYYSLLSHIVQHAIAVYSLDRLPKDYAYGHKTGWWHIHDLGISGIFIRYCSGLDMERFLMDGFKPVLPNTATSTPPKHFSTVLDHLLNFFTIFSHECYSEDTEVLTKEGFKLFKEIDIAKDEILTFNDESKTFQYEKPFRSIQKQPEFQKQIHINGLDIIVTPLHPLLVYNGNSEEFEYITAIELYDLDKKKELQNIFMVYIPDYESFLIKKDRMSFLELTDMFILRFFPLEGNLSLIDYNKPVYCVTVPSGNIIIRRNGNVVLTSNCAGAVSVSSIDVYSAPYIYKDRFYYAEMLGLDPYSEAMDKFLKTYVYQTIQRFVWNLNYPLRAGFEALFSNLTIDLSAQKSGLADRNCIWYGQILEDLKYRDLQKEVNLFNECLLDIKHKGMPDGRPFTFPIITINLTDDLDDVLNDNIKNLIYQCSARYGEFYFQNCISGEVGLKRIEPNDVRSMCLYEDEELIIKKHNKIKLVKIKDLEKNCKYDKDGWYDLDCDIETIGLNPETYKLEWVKIKRFYKTQDNILYRVSTNDGKIMRITKDHPIAVYTENGIKYKKVEDLTTDDLLIVMKNGTHLLNNEYQYLDDEILDENLANYFGKNHIFNQILINKVINSPESVIQSYLNGLLEKDISPELSRIIKILQSIIGNMSKDYYIKDLNDITIVKITCIEKIQSPRLLTFYDIELEKYHYFVHSLGSVTHNCCRLNLDKKEIYRRVGGFFSGGNNTGSICVTTLNLPRYGYVARQFFSQDKTNIEEVYENLEKIIDKVFDVVINGMKVRKELILEHSTRKYNLAPFIKAYEHPDMPTYFVTVGFVGLHECLVNMGLENGLSNRNNIEWGEKIMNLLLKKVKEYQEKYDMLINLEATPAEGAGTRLARLDKKYFT